jgi:transitional endoplasmic reticulum ATPase
MDTTLDSLEAILLKNPFDLSSREEYAARLLSAGRAVDALRQYELCAQQAPSAAAPVIGCARCLVAIGDLAAARVRYEEARTKEGFVEDTALAARLGAASSAPSPGGLRVIEGGKETPADVLPFVSVEGVRFSDVVGMSELKKLIRVKIIEPFVKPGLFAKFGKKSGGGVLLYGPPGCGKTMIARAIATECSATFLAIGISDILNMWIGESERNLAAVFDKARAEAPSVLFFDELDALAFSRAKAHSEHTRTLVNEFLNQLDGLGARNDRVLVLAATNMPWDVDGAMKRPGRFDRQVFVPPPDQEAREAMFRLKLVDAPTEGIDPGALAKLTLHCSGADIDGIIDRAKEAVLSEILEGGAERSIRHADLVEAVRSSVPSTVDWLKTARNLVKYSGDGSYRDVEAYLKSAKLA